MTKTKPYQIRKISLICMYAGFMLLIFVGLTVKVLPEQSTFRDTGLAPLLLMALILEIAFVGINFKYWRCPHCNKRWQIGHFKMDKEEKCQYCGEQIK